MKIGILSFPSAFNYGAFLQVYALKNYIERQYDFEVEVINYRNKKHLANEYRALFVKKNIFNLINNIKKWIVFRKAQRVLLNSKITTSSDSLDKYDLIIIGGDIVWDFESSYIGHDPIYYGHGLNADKIITYAASCGNSSVKNINDYVVSGLKLLDCCGVRDEESLKIAKSNAAIHSELVVDTTLLCDFGDQFDESLANQKYILIYAFEIDYKDKHSIIKFAKKNGYVIKSISFNENLSWVDENIKNVDPFYFLKIFANADYIYTSTFHGILFSIIFRKIFAIKNNKTIMQKSKWLIDELSLEKLETKKKGSVEEIFNYNNNEVYDNLFEKKIDYLINKSKEFLDRNLKNDKN